MGRLDGGGGATVVSVLESFCSVCTGKNLTFFSLACSRGYEFTLVSSAEDVWLLSCVELAMSAPRDSVLPRFSESSVMNVAMSMFLLTSVVEPASQRVFVELETKSEVWRVYSEAEEGEEDGEGRECRCEEGSDFSSF